MRLYQSIIALCLLASVSFAGNVFIGEQVVIGGKFPPTVSSGGSISSPTNIADCILCVEADQPQLSGYTNGQPVAVWYDASASARNLTPVDGTPTFTNSCINGKPAIVFTGGAQDFISAEFTNVQTAILVQSADLATDYTSLFGKGSDWNGDTVASGNVISSAYASSLVRGGSAWTNSVSVSPTAMKWDYGKWEIRELVTTGNVTVGSYSFNNIGGRVWNGRMFAVVLFSRAITTTERQQIETYFNGKLAIY